MSRSRQTIGAEGESQALRRYLDEGYTLISRNWRSRAGEIDLIMERDGVLVFCEVKTRTSSLYGTPAEAVTQAKQRRIRRLAAEFLAETGLRSRVVRFDVAAVMPGCVEIIESAF